MIVRVFLHREHAEAAATAADIDGRVRAVGLVHEHSREPYWKLPELDELIWRLEVSDPDEVFARLLREFGHHWRGDDDSAVLAAHGGGVFHDPGVRDVFLDIEPIDRGRAAGVLPRFAHGERVAVAADLGELARHAGVRGTILGNAFDMRTRRWSYVVALDGVDVTWCAEESELEGAP